MKQSPTQVNSMFYPALALTQEEWSLFSPLHLFDVDILCFGLFHVRASEINKLILTLSWSWVLYNTDRNEGTRPEPSFSSSPI